MNRQEIINKLNELIVARNKQDSGVTHVTLGLLGDIEDFINALNVSPYDKQLLAFEELIQWWEDQEL